MRRFKIDFLGKGFDTVELDGKCVELDTIILAESSLNKYLTYTLEGEHSEYSDAYREACNVDNEIFGFAPKSLIKNGTKKELENYAKDLL